MLSKFQPFRLTSELEASCRQYYLCSDINQARLGLMLFAIPLFGFVFNDFQLFGLSSKFYGLLVLRVILLFFIVFGLVYVGKLKNFASYDRMAFIGAIVLLIGSGIINATRPHNYIVQVIIICITVFSLYLVIPNRLVYQFLLSSAATVGELIIVTLFLPSPDTTVLFTIFLSLLLTNIIGFSSSWHLHSYRRRSFQDLAKNKELQSRLEQQTNHLEELVEERTEKLKSAEHLAAIGATAGMVGHDIRNPLTAITGAVYIAQNKLKFLPDGEAKDSLKKNLDLIGDQTRYVNKIVADLQDYARPLKPEIEVTDLGKAILSALSTLRIPEGIIVEHLIEMENPRLKTDPLYLQRILTNLANNALQAMANGGKLTVRATRQDNKVLICIEDTGVGIAEEMRSKLFTPLVTTKSKGQGFGLAVVKRLTEALGGKVTFNSEIGKGTKFIVELPDRYEEISIT
jgi:signal transduction histidine kinase